MTSIESGAEAVPRLPGPKLSPFTPTGYADIEFIKELGKPAEDMDSFVWKVRIDGMPSCYALKMVRLLNVLCNRVERAEVADVSTVPVQLASLAAAHGS